MDQLEYVIDPDGEVTMELRDANQPFAEWDEVPITAPDPEDLDDSETDGEQMQEDIDQEQYDSDEDSTDSTGKCFRIQVSAKHLKLVSPVFKNLLSGGWKENATLLQRGSVEITTEGWDIEAFLILLRVIHCQHKNIPRKLTLEMLAKVAVLADYYQCKEAVGVFADIWITALDHPISMTYSRDLILWIWISWFFRLSDKFRRTTSTAMSQSNGWIDALGLPIPDKILDSMNHARQKIIGEKISLLHKKHEAFLSGKKGCSFECSSIIYGALTKHMHSKGLISPKPKAPFLNLNYEQLMQHLQAFKSPKWFGPDHDCDINYKRHSCDHSNFKSIFGPNKTCIDGLELDSIIPPNE